LRRRGNINLHILISSFLDPRALDHMRPTHSSHNDISPLDNTLNISSGRVTDSNSSIPMHQQHSDGHANKVTPPQNDGIRALNLDPRLVQQLDVTLRGAGYVKGDGGRSFQFKGLLSWAEVSAFSSAIFSKSSAQSWLS